MSLYAIGDLHLHFQTNRVPRGQLKDRLWKGHEEKFQKNCLRLLSESDTLVLVGDHSWGRTMEECGEDFRFIMELPGRKILLRGNHDMFWDANKTAKLNEAFAGKLEFLQDTYFAYQDYALVGTKGFTFEGLFAIYALYQTTVFTGAVSASGSLWFPGFLDYAASHKMPQTPDRIYLSLGDREKNTKNAFMCRVEENTVALHRQFREQGIACIFELNPGNHFQEVEQRLAKGIAWVVSDTAEGNHLS